MLMSRVCFRSSSGRAGVRTLTVAFSCKQQWFTPYKLLEEIAYLAKRPALKLIADGS